MSGPEQRDRAVQTKKRVSVPKLVLIVIAALIVASLVLLVVVAVIPRQSTPQAASSTSTAAEATPGSAPTIDSLGDSERRTVSGCVAGTGITGEDLLQLRRTKDFTVEGAAEFLGGFLQVTSAADPEWRSGIDQVVNIATTGTAHDLLKTQVQEGTPYADAQKHTADLSKGAFKVVKLTSHTVTIDIAAATTTDGKPDVRDGKVNYTGGEFVLTATDGGWVVSGASGDGDWRVNATQSGTTFKEGC
ncbi:hypothetical protein DEJ13_17855 (plasmid) [Curtobacterium sp. MCLR17_007]|uniref:hypothetical protein n=1 Tax=Curtobacterium sp. MCLR17_007 TaxID=2175648 RepID=UPI000DA91A8D|nr:hypothetical protein [Curtobacterium sp. MCLR17_007]WIB62137.1 hypothetical protein DEJ13_17855 [Curtobacterium sp. MCLR17_007]